MTHVLNTLVPIGVSERSRHWSRQYSVACSCTRLSPGPRLPHCIDVTMTTMASQITSLTVVYSTVYSDADQRKNQSSASLAFVWGIHRERWIPRTKGQLRGKCSHLMTSSCVFCNWMLTKISVKFESKYEIVHSPLCIWKPFCDMSVFCSVLLLSLYANEGIPSIRDQN